jgi:hypothetical protein
MTEDSHWWDNLLTPKTKPILNVNSHSLICHPQNWWDKRTNGTVRGINAVEPWFLREEKGMILTGRSTYALFVADAV